MAVADCAQYGDPAPPELSLAWKIQQWGPPDGKGWLEWPAGQVDRLTVALNVYNAMSAYAASSGTADWFDSNPVNGRTVGRILKMRMGLDDGNS